MSKLLEEFKNYLHEMNQYEHVVTLLYWDMKTNAPKLGQEAHIEALTHFSTKSFEMSTADKLGEMLDGLAEESEFTALDVTWQFIVRRMKRDFDRNKRIPAEVYEAFVRAQAESGNAWEEAKNSSDFSVFAPHLKKMVEMTKEIAGYTDPGVETYDALLNQYEEGMDSATIDRLFGELKQELIPLVQQILAKPQPDDTAFHAYADPDAQKKVQWMLLDYIGFRRDAGAVGETEHPFTLNFSSKDVRVTNHYYETEPISAMFSAIHEGGHGIFEQNVNPEYDNTVAGSCCYMGIHESQSRFYENILGRNKNFWLPIYDKLGELLPQFREISLDDFYREINHVRNSFIRTEADEVTYCFHIILRYEMEKAIFRDGVSVEELPTLWNQKMQEYLQITPKNDAEGILQDMHWSDGSFGYFPSYLLGSIYDGMYLDTMEAELGSVDKLLAEGRIAEITKWLNEKIHQYGSTRTPKEVIEAVCGKEVSAEPLVRYFKKKYTEVYGL
ncbi:MAG: carboxypeptidase M32 [Clostridiales bacterium]|nr:carboxypeptidase M32 [Roseburia sp.]MDD7636915.1 carboxypeptidase M32 [Clostridiales bacterium]MDY4113462.1 carboxypeptidase M32 [Roseburia sp.]